MIRDYIIHRFLREPGRRTSWKEVSKAVGSDEETKRPIEEKLRVMGQFDTVTIDREIVSAGQFGKMAKRRSIEGAVEKH